MQYQITTIYKSREGRDGQIITDIEENSQILSESCEKNGYFTIHFSNLEYKSNTIPLPFPENEHNFYRL